MDISIINFNSETKELKIASALSSPVLIKSNDDTTIRFKGDRIPIGGSPEMFSNERSYTLDSTIIKERSMLYLFSDGYQDQFGGLNDKKFMQKRFRELLKSINHFSPPKQREHLSNEFSKWKGEYDQVDDVLVLGIELIP